MYKLLLSILLHLFVDFPDAGLDEFGNIVAPPGGYGRHEPVLRLPLLQMLTDIDVVSEREQSDFFRWPSEISNDASKLWQRCQIMMCYPSPRIIRERFSSAELLERRMFCVSCREHAEGKLIAYSPRHPRYDAIQQFIDACHMCEWRYTQLSCAADDHNFWGLRWQAVKDLCDDVGMECLLAGNIPHVPLQYFKELD